MDDGAYIQTNMMAQNVSYGIGGCGVNSNINDNNTLHVRAVLKIKFPFN
jgi:hypothetical protein